MGIETRYHFDYRKPPPLVEFFYLAGFLTKNLEKEDSLRSTWYKFFKALGSCQIENPPGRGGFVRSIGSENRDRGGI